MTGSDGVSLRFPQLFLSQQRLEQKLHPFEHNCVRNKKRSLLGLYYQHFWVNWEYYLLMQMLLLE
ncbi:Protein of unknown function, partial [Gryllus bimaculatus]